MQVRELDQELVAGQIVPPDALFDVQPELAYVGEDAFSGLR